ncbi:MAG: 4-amino-4-deoxy-L-arabinose transferase [Deltaproteobacteria bacterium]|nr:4-amino-4-deoxy-L-arabinose transferase [Deltaproteobacteria bacterium]MBW2119340.1 4-amino-4-deoxy-L-arabinose transferase [Deltaproteobacteria bacterium]MBW2344077.1 4-amino-4-deoxy-L-arabinose transferase [Deltaproteobacteria bacterium]
MNRYIPLILAGVLLNATAQIFIKHGMKAVGNFAFTLNNLTPIGLKVAVNPYVLSGMACYAVSIVVWLMVLSRVDVSYAYPLLSAGYIVTAVAGKILFGETLGFDRCTGILVICIGVYLITRSG